MCPKTLLQIKKTCMREIEKSLSGWGEASVFDGGCRLSNHHDLSGGMVADFDKVGARGRHIKMQG